MDKQEQILLEEADWFFRKMVRRFVKERDRIAIEGMALPAFMVLRKLEQDGEQRLGDLAEQFDFTSGAVTALCDKLEEGGFAIRKRLPGDRRTVFLSITDKGKKLLVRHANIGAGCIGTLFGSFTKEELAGQIDFFRRMIDNLELFSSTILRLAEENAAKPPDQAAEGDKPHKPSDSGNYFTY